MADAGGGDVFRGQQSHDAPANVYEGPEGLHAYHLSHHHGSRLQTAAHFLHSLFLDLPAGEQGRRRAFRVGGEGFHRKTDLLSDP